MKPPKIITAALFAVIACLAACTNTDPAAIARQEKAAKIGNRLLDMGVRYGIVTKSDAEDFREIGEIILKAPTADAEQPATDAKNPPKVPVFPLGFRRPTTGPTLPQYCANQPRAPPMARTILS